MRNLITVNRSVNLLADSDASDDEADVKADVKTDEDGVTVTDSDRIIPEAPNWDDGRIDREDEPVVIQYCSNQESAPFCSTAKPGRVELPQPKKKKRGRPPGSKLNLETRKIIPPTTKAKRKEPVNKTNKQTPKQVQREYSKSSVGSSSCASTGASSDAKGLDIQ